MCIPMYHVSIPVHDICSPITTRTIKFMGCSSGKYINRGGRWCHDRLEEWTVESKNEKDMW